MILFLSSCSQGIVDNNPNRIYIQGQKFYSNGSEIFLAGANTPWDKWNDFGGDFDTVFWSSEMKRLADNSMNSTRIWISCDGEGQPFIDSLGNAQKPTQKFWQDVDFLMKSAQENGIYVMATLMSFDHADSTKPIHKAWRKMLANPEKIELFAQNYVVPFVERYKENPYLFSIDLCNEPEWMMENEKYGKLPKEYLQQYAAICSRAVHAVKSPVLVSIGSACIKWNSELYDGNMWANEELQKFVDGDTLAFMDYWQVHYYAWINEYNGNPFEMSPADYKINDRPVVIGETPGNNEIYGIEISYEEMYDKPYKLGYVGVLPWTSNGAGIGGFGSLETFGKGAQSFNAKYPNLVRK